jgi:hypothetical protein
MKGTLTIIQPDGTVTSETLDQTTTENSLYQKLKTGLNDGYLELVPLFSKYEGEKCVVFCDEDGRGKGLVPNTRATALWHAGIRGGGREPSDTLTTLDVIVGLVGPIVIVRGDRELFDIL